jgi:hypothetical protein
VLFQAVIQGAHRLDKTQPGPDGAMRIVFMRLRIAKVDEQPITQILGNVAVKALDHLRTGGLIGLDHLAQVFRVEVTGEHGRVYQVAKQHGKLAAFGVGWT